MKRLFLFSVLLILVLGTTNVALANDKMIKPQKIKLNIDNDYKLVSFTHSYTYHLSCCSDYDTWSGILTYTELTVYWNLKNTTYCPYNPGTCSVRVENYGTSHMDVYSYMEMITPEDCPPL